MIFTKNYPFDLLLKLDHDPRSLKKMFEGEIMVDRYRKDILSPVGEMTFDRNTMRQMDI